MANGEQLAILKQGAQVWNEWRKNNPETRLDFRGADLAGADLHDANLHEVNLFRANLSGAILNEANLVGANLREANLNGAELYLATLFNAELREADLNEAMLSGANLRRVDLSWARLSRANLSQADLRGADLRGADLSGADLTGANLTRCHLVETNLAGARLVSCKIYGISAWELKLDGAIQQDFIITPDDMPAVTVDDLEVAQFIYLLLDNRKIRNIIDSVSSKLVLILGRFSRERKPVLDALRDKLRQLDYVPVVFDFEPSPHRDLTETVQMLANMSKLVIADLTDAKSIPQELSHIIPLLPSVPVQPILLASQNKPYSMFEHWKRYPWVQPVFMYRDEQHLLSSLEQQIIVPALEWRSTGETVEALKRENLEKDRQIEELRRQLGEPAS